MPDYFLSDVHLRLDQPDRGRRLALLVDRLRAGDSLTIVGDLCDFWYAARQFDADPMACAGLRSLASFRDRGGGDHGPGRQPRRLDRAILRADLRRQIRPRLAGHPGPGAPRLDRPRASAGGPHPLEVGAEEPGLPGRLPQGPHAAGRRLGGPAPADEFQEPGGVRSPGGWPSTGSTPPGRTRPTTWSSSAMSIARSTPRRTAPGWSSSGAGITTPVTLSSTAGRPRTSSRRSMDDPRWMRVSRRKGLQIQGIGMIILVTEPARAGFPRSRLS